MTLTLIFLLIAGWTLTAYYLRKQDRELAALKKTHLDERTNDAQVITTLEIELSSYQMTQELLQHYLEETGQNEKFYDFVRDKLPAYHAQQLH